MTEDTLLAARIVLQAAEAAQSAVRSKAAAAFEVAKIAPDIIEEPIDLIAIAKSACDWKETTTRYS